MIQADAISARANTALRSPHDKTIIYGDINGDARPDFQIELTGLKALVPSDFIL